MAYRLGDRAENDLDDIWLYITEESGNPEIADRFVHSFAERFRLLDTNPMMGRRRDDLERDVRSFPADEYVILYQLRETGIVVLRVLHGHRNIKALIKSQPLDLPSQT
jgi:toxin ParE1/3/4